MTRRGKKILEEIPKSDYEKEYGENQIIEQSKRIEFYLTD